LSIAIVQKMNEFFERSFGVSHLVLKYACARLLLVIFNYTGTCW